MHRLKFLCAAVIAATIVSSALGHPGRRFEILVIDDQLVAQGYLSPGVMEPDSSGNPRPYYNSLHDHWSNSLGSSVNASADLPGFDLLDASSFAGTAGASLSIELVASKKWESPPAMPGPGTVPNFEALGTGETIFIEYGTDFFDTASPGSFTLASNITGPISDIDLDYSIDDEPTGVLYVLEWVLSTNVPGIADSDPIHVILSPQMELHHASLYTEAYLGTPIPEPATIVMLLFGIVPLAIALRRRRLKS